MNPTGGYENQPPPPLHHGPAAGNGRWSSGLFDCFSDGSTCCLTFWCPCVTFGRLAEIADQGSTSCCVSGSLWTLIAMVTGSCTWIYSCLYRSKIRREYMLDEAPCHDCLVHCLCEQCALCQEYRELKSRGFDMSLGWHGNEAMHHPSNSIAMAPVFQPEMKR